MPTRHGAVVIPADAVAKILAAVDLLTRREKVIIEASKQPGFSIERLRQAYKDQDEIHHRRRLRTAGRLARPLTRPGRSRS